MREFTTPPTTVTARLVGGVLTAIFDGVPYERQIMSIVVNCSPTSVVNVYRGAVSPASQIGTHPVGNQNTYMPPNRDVIPAGFPMFVTWPTATSGSAIAVFKGRM